MVSDEAFPDKKRSWERNQGGIDYRYFTWENAWWNREEYISVNEDNYRSCVYVDFYHV